MPFVYSVPFGIGYGFGRQTAPASDLLTSEEVEKFRICSWLITQPRQTGRMPNSLCATDLTNSAWAERQ